MKARLTESKTKRVLEKFIPARMLRRKRSVSFGGFGWYVTLLDFMPHGGVYDRVYMW